jgi:PAS domain S-box-containing protein
VTSERILVVDDEEAVVRTCVRILQRRGYETIGLTESDQAQGYLEQESFDLLLTDIRMPGVDGLELLAYAKAVDPHLSVVLFTGYGTLDDAMRAMRLGAQGFILKPFDPEEMVAVVQENSQRRRLQRDSMRLQTLLPLLEVSSTIQRSDGAISMIEQALRIAQAETGAARLRLMFRPAQKSDSCQLVEVGSQFESGPWLEESVLHQVLETGEPSWITADGTLRQDKVVARQAVAICLPLSVKKKVVAVLAAETAAEDSPLGHLALDILAVFGGQLAIAIENVNLFRRIETLRTFNEDIIENMTNGVIALDLAGRITACNRTAAALLDCLPQAVIGHPIDIIKTQAGELVASFQEALRHQAPVSYREATVYHKDGRRNPVSISVSPLRDGGRSVAGVVGVVEDLTELKDLEAERRRLDRLAALGEMSAVVAHEIRNPIAAIAAGVEYITRQLGEDSPHREGAQMIQGEIERMNRILEDILFVARPLHLDLHPHSLPEIIDTVIKRFRAQIERHQAIIQSSYGGELPLVRVDKARLEQALTNLLINAIQSIPPGGRINLQVKSDGRKVYISVQDNGPGIPAETLARIFEPFFTTRAQGTGLGLAVTQRVIQEHGGSLSAESVEGQSTTFLIDLPVEGTPTREP